MNKSLRAKVALAELEAMGLTVDDLLDAAGTAGLLGPTTPTVAEYVPVVTAGYKPRTRADLQLLLEPARRTPR
jgi:hypothetical protein